LFCCYRHFIFCTAIANRAKKKVITNGQQIPPEPLKAIVEEVASLLKARKETISVAETAVATWPCFGVSLGTLISWTGPAE
jgi:hypothetical protein